MSSDFQLYVISHKPINHPKVPEGYKVLQVGNGTSFSTLRDNSGKSISFLNENYCELTAQYWVWKNFRSEYVGFVHYRRFFSSMSSSHSKEDIADKEYLFSLFKTYELISIEPEVVIKGRIGELFSKLHSSQPLVYARRYISDFCPSYLNSFDVVMKSHIISYYNIYAMCWDLFDDYMNWLFPILNFCYKKVDASQFSPYNKRYIGFLAERLFNVWLRYKQPKYCILPLLETDQRINKFTDILKRNFIKYKYRNLYPNIR